MQSHNSEGNPPGSGDPRQSNSDPVSKSVGRCPTVTATFGSVELECLLDSGFTVTTITQSFFAQHFQESLHYCHWLDLHAANGLATPYLGYFEVDVVELGKVVPGQRILVVRDPPAHLPQPEVPGVLGMDVIML